jgi:hypothetical protein
MKIVLFTLALLLFFACGSSTEDEKPAPGIMKVQYTTVGDKSASIYWIDSLATDIKAVIIEISNDSTTFKEDSVYIGLNKTVTINNLINETKYYFRIKAKNNSDIVGTSSNIVSAKLTDGGGDLTGGWNVFNTNYNTAISFFNKVISNNFVKIKQAYEGKGWAYLYLSNGDKNSVNITNATSSFNNAGTTNDVRAGSGILYLLTENYSAVTTRLSVIDALGSYQHPYLTKVTQKYIRIHYAFALFYSKDYTTTKAVLDKIDPSVVHTVLPEDQLKVLQTFSQEVNASVMQKLNSIKFQ